jgi:hypothetical protein
MRFEIPKPMKLEHVELHGCTPIWSRRQRRAGERVRLAVAKILHRNFLKEEEYALPPLGAEGADRRRDR